MSLLGFQAQNHPQQDAQDRVDDRKTPEEVFAPLHEQYEFTVDVAAAEHNALLPRFFDRESDGLGQSWEGERVWCNPPYSDIRPWIEKTWREKAELVVMLLPANRTDQSWWQELVEPYRDRTGSPLKVTFLSGRIRFLAPRATVVPPNSRPPFGCCLLTWMWSLPDIRGNVFQLEAFR